MNRQTPYLDPVEAHSFEEHKLRRPDLSGPALWRFVDESSTGARAACWARVHELADLHIESEMQIERHMEEPWCPGCHDRRIEHEPGDCAKYSGPEKGIPTSTSSERVRVEFDHTDVLKTVPTHVYVTAFTGVPVPANGRILCPLHDDAPSPSFKCYGLRWTCFGGCGSGADIYDLASALTGIEPKGGGFIELRRWIATALLGGGLRA